MKKLTSKLAPEDFSHQLSIWRKVWRRTCLGVAGRRSFRKLSRRRVRWYKRVRGISSLPKLARPADVASVWQAEAPENAKIIFVPEPASPDDGDVATEFVSARKRVRRKLRIVYNVEARTRIELLSAKKLRNSDCPSVGQAEIGKRRVSRGIFLEAIGAAIVPGMSKHQVAALESAGAIVLDNTLISIVDPDTCSDQSDPQLGSDATSKWHHSTICLAAARQKGLTGKGTLIGIADTGIDLTHPDFSGKTIYFQSFGANGQRVRRKAPKDYGIHGTHVAGLCADIASNAQIAVAAVLTIPTADGMSGRTAQLLAGINWLASGGNGNLPRPVDIINASFGSVAGDDYYFPILNHHIQGVLTVAAIGNRGRNGIGNHSAPGKFDYVVGVGAVDTNGQIADFSDWGPAKGANGALSAFKPDLVAPGVDIMSTVPGGKHLRMSGTSMACPIVAGAAALLIEQNPELRGNPEKLAAKLLTLTRALPSQASVNASVRVGSGVLDLSGV